MTYTNSEIVHHAGGTTLDGPDAVNLFRAVTLASSLRLYAETGMRVNRMVTPTLMLSIAREYTGKAYKRGQYAQAATDVQKWIDTMKAALPITDNRQEAA